MNRPSVGLAIKESDKIDMGLEEAIWSKNTEIRTVKTGILAVDRAPLDFIAFPTKRGDTIGKTARDRFSAVLKRLLANKMQDVCHGQVILVRADTQILLERQLQRGRIKTSEKAQHRRYLEHQKKCLDTIYKKAISEGSVVETNRCSIAASAKAAARIIHFDEYKPFRFAQRLEQIKKGK